MKNAVYTKVLTDSKLQASSFVHVSHHSIQYNVSTVQKKRPPSHTQIKSLLLGKTPFRKSPIVNERLLGIVFPLILAGITILLAYLNHVSNTWLTGWDTLHPEFNFQLNLFRTLNGLFRYDQGLGTVATHAHMVELPRILLLWIGSILIPTHLLRYTYVAACLILGPLGIYVLVKHLLRNAGFAKSITQVAAFLTGLWYIFNLGTLQHFRLPFEMFPTNYAANGWLFFFTIKYLQTKKKVWLILLTTTNFVASNMAYSFVSWYVYFGCLVLFLISWWFAHRKNKFPLTIKQVILTLGAVLSVNLYWILPNIYFVTQHSWHVPLAKNNQFVSEEIFYHNKEYGTISDTVSMKNHLFSWKIKDSQEFVQVFESFQNHLESRAKHVPQILGLFILLAFIYTLIYREKNNKNISTKEFSVFFLILFFAFSSFLVINPPFDFIVNPLRESIPIIKEGLRNPFIKVNLMLMLAYAVFFGLGIALTINWLNKLYKSLRPILVASLVLISSLILYLGYPFFNGELIDKRVQLQIPTEYFELFSWFNHQPNSGRILVLPAPSFWAWDYHSWGYQGAGFMWFGLPQPFFSRDSDRWNPYNEEAYREISQALDEQNSELFSILLKKYEVGWVVLDTSVTSQDKGLSTNSQIEQVLNNQDLILEKVFSDKLKVYKAKPNTNSDLIQVVDKFKTVDPIYRWAYHDAAYQEYGPYIEDASFTANSVHYPFRDIIGDFDKLDTNRITRSNSQITLDLQYHEQKWQYSLPKSNLIKSEVIFFPNSDGVIISFRSYFGSKGDKSRNELAAVQVHIEENSAYKILINNQLFDIPLDHSQEYSLGSVNLFPNKPNSFSLFNVTQNQESYQFNFGQSLVTNCHPNKLGDIRNVVKDNASLSFISNNAITCVNGNIQHPDNLVTLATPYLLATEIQTTAIYNQNIGSSEAELCIVDDDSTNCLNKKEALIINPQIPFNIQSWAPINIIKDQALKFIYIVDSSKLSESKVTVSDIRFSYFPPVMNSSFTVQEDQQFLVTDEQNEIIIPVLDDIVIKPSDYDYPPPKCDATPRTQISRQILNEQGKDFVRYQAKYGMSCDSFSLPDLSHSFGYIIDVTSRNVSGLPSRLCVQNSKTKKCNLHVALTESKEFEQELFLLPPSDNEQGYEILLNSLAPGRHDSVNDIESISLTPIPYYQLLSMHSIPTESTANQNQLLITSPTSFEPNMIAFWQKDLTNIELIDNHVLANNWENGWLVDSNDYAEKIRSGYKIKVLFWPQWLEWMGLIAGSFWLISLAINSILSRSKR